MATLQRPRGHHLPFSTLLLGFLKGRICGSLFHTSSFIRWLVNILPLDRDLETSPPGGPEGTSTVSQQGGNAALYFLPSHHHSLPQHWGTPAFPACIMSSLLTLYPELDTAAIQTLPHPCRQRTTHLAPERCSNLPRSSSGSHRHSCCPRILPELQQHLPHGHLLPQLCPPQSFPKKTSEFSV